MSRQLKARHLIAGAAVAALTCGAAAFAADSNIPDFMQNGVGRNPAGGMEPVAGGPMPVGQDPKVKYVPNNVGGQPTWRYADVNNPNLTDFAKDGLRQPKMAIG